jgi:hypothetical protein
MAAQEIKPLLPPWLLSPPRRWLWWAMLIGVSCAQIHVLVAVVNLIELGP